MKTDWFTIEEVRKNVYAIAEWKHFERVVSYLFVGTQDSVLFDTGMGYESISVAVSRITRAPVRVLLTHTHWDHIGGMGEFSDVSVYDHTWETANCRAGFQSVQVSELMDTSMFDLPWKPKQYISNGVKNYQVFHHEDHVVCNPWVIDVIYTPGHSPGSVCFSINEFDMLISGDTVYPGPLYAFLPESDISAYHASLCVLRTLVSRHTVILPGHNAVESNRAILDEAVLLFDRVQANPLKQSGDGAYRIQTGKQVSVYY